MVSCFLLRMRTLETGLIPSGVAALSSPLTLIFHRGRWLALAGAVAGFWTWILGPGMTVVRLSGRGGRGFHGSQEFPSLLIGTGLCCSGGARDGLDALPGGDDFPC